MNDLSPAELHKIMDEDFDAYMMGASAINNLVRQMVAETKHMSNELKDLRQFKEWASPQCEDYAANRMEIARLQAYISQRKWERAADSAMDKQVAWTTPWYHFWNLQSGFFGGCLTAVLFWVVVGIIHLVESHG